VVSGHSALRQRLMREVKYDAHRVGRRCRTGRG
jgi:hypothetical protein